MLRFLESDWLFCCLILCAKCLIFKATEIMMIELNEQHQNWTSLVENCQNKHTSNFCRYQLVSTSEKTYAAHHCLLKTSKSRWSLWPQYQQLILEIDVSRQLSVLLLLVRTMARNDSELWWRSKRIHSFLLQEQFRVTH